MFLVFLSKNHFVCILDPSVTKEFMKKTIIKITLPLFVFTLFFAYTAENSIIPLIEQFESLQNIPHQIMKGSGLG